MNKLGVHWIPAHNRPSDLEYMQNLQPACVLILDLDIAQVDAVLNHCQNTLLIFRDWALSEQKDDCNKFPVETGERHAREWKQKLDTWRADAQKRGLKFPNNPVVMGINEPQVWGNDGSQGEQWNIEAKWYMGRVDTYNNAFLRALSGYGISGTALNLSVGWPTNWSVPDAAPDWSFFPLTQRALLTGDHWLSLHEYWPKDGPLSGWGWYAGRYMHCPWQCKILITESGMSQRVIDGSVAEDASGWGAYMNAEQYAAQLNAYSAELMKDDRIFAHTPFTTDFGHPWDSFDTQNAHSDILRYKTINPPPIISTSPTLPNTETIEVVLANLQSKLAEVNDLVKKVLALI